MFEKLRKFLNLENTEMQLRGFSGVLEESEMLKSEINLMAREYLSGTQGLKDWADGEKELEVLELIKSQQDGLTSRYLHFLSDKQKHFTRLEALRQSYIRQHPDFEKALVELKKSDFIEKTLANYRLNVMTLAECDTIIKAVTKKKVLYSDNIVFNLNGEILIEQRQPQDTNANLWCLPGGHLNPEESHEAAAKRELLEETGYVVEDVTKVGELDEGNVHIEYFVSMMDPLQAPTVYTDETSTTAFVQVKKLYEYPTFHNI